MQQRDLCPFVHVEVIEKMGVITLDRPKALNALSLDMIRAISGVLEAFETDAQISHVLMRGAEGRAFCAGGDIRSFYDAGMAYQRGEINLKTASLFFAEEYALDQQIYHYSKPLISFMNGITMGGGFGLAGNCKHRIATDQTIFAMPEVQIGFFPDVGSIYHLLKVPDHIGHYLALSGQRINGADMLDAGLADYYMPAAHEGELLAALGEVGDEQGVVAAIDRFTAPSKGALVDDKADIAKVFSLTGLAEIFRVLEGNQDAWAQSALEMMRKASPTSLGVTFEYLKRASGLSFDDVIAQDFILMQHFMAQSDLFEGIHAVVIDKEHVPRWEPSCVDNVEDAVIQQYFVAVEDALKRSRN